MWMLAFFVALVGIDPLAFWKGRQLNKRLRDVETRLAEIERN